MRRGEREYILMKNFRAEEPEPGCSALKKLTLKIIY